MRVRTLVNETEIKLKVLKEQNETINKNQKANNFETDNYKEEVQSNSDEILKYNSHMEQLKSDLLFSGAQGVAFAILEEENERLLNEIENQVCVKTFKYKLNLFEGE